MSLWRSLFGLSPSSSNHIGNTGHPKSTTPIADRKFGLLPWGSLIRFGLIFGVPLALLFIYGQPALRIQYQWSGNRAHPIYHQCDYLTLFNGWRDVHPRFGYCPLVTTFPFELSHLIGE